MYTPLDTDEAAGVAAVSTGHLPAPDQVAALVAEAYQRYRTLDEALTLANDTRYGLQAAIFTADLTTAMRAVQTLDFGGVLVNEVPTYRTDQMPYGGLRDSGNTREGPRYAVEEMTEPRLVIIQLPT